MTPGDYRRKFQLPDLVARAAASAKARGDGANRTPPLAGTSAATTREKRSPARSARPKSQTVS